MDTRETLLMDAASRAASYLAEIDTAPVGPTSAAVQTLKTFRQPFPDRPTDPAHVLAELDEAGKIAAVSSAGGRYFGFVCGGTVPAALAAGVLVSAWDQNAGLYVSSPIAAELEQVGVDWVIEALGLPAGSAGGVVTGATMANFTGLAAARHALLEQAGWDVEANGLFGAPELRVVVGQEVHASLLKVLALLGLGRDRVIPVAADGQGRMLADSLPSLDERTILCIQAGNVNTGAFDPAGELCARAHAAGAWVHVDGAFGLWAAASQKYRHLAAGFELADSWATDGHKWPNVGYDCGVALVREAKHLTAAMGISAAYLQTSVGRDPAFFTPESSRRARGVELWAALKSLGRTGLADLIDRTCSHARRFADGLKNAGYAILNEVVINQVLVSFGEPEVTREVIAQVQRDGTCWCGGTVWQGKTAMRISVSSWVTSNADVEQSLAAILDIANRVNSRS